MDHILFLVQVLNSIPIQSCKISNPESRLHTIAKQGLYHERAFERNIMIMNCYFDHYPFINLFSSTGFEKTLK